MKGYLRLAVVLAVLLLASTCFGQESLGGVGLVLGIDKERQQVAIMKVLPDSPAAKAGLTPGALIHSIDGRLTAGKVDPSPLPSPLGGEREYYERRKLEECVALMRGVVGTKVIVEVADLTGIVTNKLELTRAPLGFSVAAPTARLGDTAAQLNVKHWVKGEPVDVLDGKRVYLIEFWATWCGPCIASMPHLSELQQKYRDAGLVIIGVSDEPEATVRPFVKKMGKKMDYTVVCDDERKSYRSYMEAYGRSGIPATFIVDKNRKVAWIGHPMSLKESELQQMLEGTFDVSKAAAAYENRTARAKAEAPFWAEFQRSLKNKEWDAADAAVAKLENARPENERDQVRVHRFELLMERKDYEAAYRLAARLSDTNPNDLGIQSQLAWRMSTGPEVVPGGLDLAEKIARRANDAGKGQECGVLDTLARILFRKGQKDAAIEYQTKAVELADEHREKPFQKTLDRYRKASEEK